MGDFCEGEHGVGVMDDKGSSGRRRFNGRGKAIFLQEIAAVRADLAKGSMRYAYQGWGPKLQVSYSQFARYVKTHIKDPDRRREAEQRRHRAGLASSPAPSLAFPLQVTPRQAPGAPPRRFHFDPMSVDRKDLV